MTAHPIQVHNRRAVLWGRLVCWALLLFALVPAAAHGAEPRVDVRYVVDGDTVVLTDGRTVRIPQIDTPELGRDGRFDDEGAQAARNRLVALTRGGALRLRFDGGPDHDRYGRVLATLILPQGEDVREVLLREGYAWLYLHRALPDTIGPHLFAAQRQALEQGRGFWPAVRNHLRGRGPFVGNANSYRFGDAGCGPVATIAPRNRIHFATAAEAFRAGFSPYRSCNLFPTSFDTP